MEDLSQNNIAVGQNNISVGQNNISVGIGEMKVTKDPTVVLAAYGLGSCVGVSVYDPVVRVGGLAHVMLPSSKEANHSTPGYKFADLAVPALIEQLMREGSKGKGLVCKLAGGAQVLSAPGRNNAFRIGERNVEAVKEALRQLGITPTAMDTGGSRGRTLRLVVHTGQVLVKTVGGQSMEL